jgi:hypothetical protein
MLYSLSKWDGTGFNVLNLLWQFAFTLHCHSHCTLVATACQPGCVALMMQTGEEMVCKRPENRRSTEHVRDTGYDYPTYQPLRPPIEDRHAQSFDCGQRGCITRGLAQLPGMVRATGTHPSLDIKPAILITKAAHNRPILMPASPSRGAPLVGACVPA